MLALIKCVESQVTNSYVQPMTKTKQKNARLQSANVSPIRSELKLTGFGACVLLRMMEAAVKVLLRLLLSF